MKILYIAHEGGQDFNGASRSLLTLVKYFSVENDVFVVLPVTGGMMEQELKKCKCKILVYNYYRWVVSKGRNPVTWMKKRNLWRKQEEQNAMVVDQLADFCIQNGIDIIHTNSGVVNIGALVSLKTNIPHVWHFREFQQEDFHMYPLVSHQKWTSLMRDGANIIVAVSEAVRKKFIDLVPDANIRTVYNGIPIHISENKEAHQTFNILIAGAITAAKGQKIAIQAVKQILQSGYEDVNLFIAGYGDTKELEEMVSDYSEKFHFLGMVSEMEKLRSNMDLELVCSKSEAFGRVTVEAMAASLPVIGTNVGGTPELIESEMTGLLVPYGDVTALKDSILKLYLNRNLCAEMGRRAADSVKGKFSEKQLVDNISKIYEEILENE